MALIQLLPQAETLRVEVTARSERANRHRRGRISEARLMVYSAAPSARRRFQVTIKGPAWHRTGLPPYSWLFVPGDLDNRIGPVLRVFLAPGAYIENLDEVFERARLAFRDPHRRTGPYQAVPLGLEVVRVCDSNLLPELGRFTTAPFRGYAPRPWSHVAGSFWDIDEQQDSLQFMTASPEHEPTVSVLPDGLLVSKAAHGRLPRWQVRITTPRDQPAAFSYNLLGRDLPESAERQLAPDDRAHLRTHQNNYTLRVVKTENVDIALAVEHSSRASADLSIEYHVVKEEMGRRTGEPALILPNVPQDPLATAAWNHVALVPAQGTYLDPRRFQFYTLTHQNRQALRGMVPSFGGWSDEALTRHQVIGDPIPIQGRRRGEQLGRVAPRTTSSFTPEIQFAITAFELAIGLIPIIGTLYDIVSLLHLSATGRSLWGERRDLSYWDLLGVGGLGLGLLGEAASAGRAFQRAADLYDRANSTRRGMHHVLHHLDPPMRRSVRPAVPRPSRGRNAPPPRRREADISSFSASTFSTRGNELVQTATRQARQRQVQRLSDLKAAIEEIGADIDEVLGEVLVDAPNLVVNRLRGSSSSQQLARYLLEASGGEAPDYAARLIEQHERARLLAVFTPDFSGFSNDLLAQGFRAHNTRRMARGQRPRTAASWALVTRGQYLAELTVVLGTRFRRRVRRAQALGTLSELDDNALNSFRELRRRPQAYTDLVRARTAQSSSTTDLGAFFDADHLMEKRFINQIRERLPNIDTGSLQALLAPKDQAVLRRLRRLDAGLSVYDHATKTQLMRALIPYREQHLFSIQQWWDAHVWVYRQLETENLNGVLAALETDFNRVASALGESFNPRRNLPDWLELVPSNQVGRRSSSRATP